MSLVSIVVPVYNCEPYVRQAIDSLLHQSYTNIEILVCDDCSTDGTLKILNSYTDKRICVLNNDVNRGVVYTRNFLLSKAKGDFILIQDGDDWSARNRIEVLLNVFKKHQDVDVCGTGHFRVTSGGAVIKSSASKIGHFILTLDDCFNLPFMPATLMLRYRVFKNLGGYDDFFARLLVEDLYWIVRMVQKYTVYYLNEPLYYYRFNTESITNTFDNRDKLLVVALISQFINQRKMTGTDWLEQQNISAIEQFKSEKFDDKKWLSEQYRIAAAVQCDGKKYGLAWQIIKQAFRCNPFNWMVYRTALYMVKSRFFSRSE